MTNLLTEKQAYLAMFEFLEGYYNRLKSDDIGSLLGWMSLIDDDRPIDLAVWIDWEKAVQKAVGGNVDAELRLSKESDSGSEESP